MILTKNIANSIATGNQIPPRYSLTNRKYNAYFWGYFMIFPVMIGLLLFYIYPFFQTLFYSFTDLGAFGEYSWIGLGNFKRMLSDTRLWMALKNTMLFTLLSVPLNIGISIFIAALLNSKIRGVGIYRTLYYLPTVTMEVAVALVWKWLFNTDFGIINFLLSKIGISGPSWISNPDLALYVIVIIAVLKGVGYNMVILLAGLQGISNSYYESAEIDGAGAVRKFFNITIPLLTPTIFFVMVMSLIKAFQVFGYIFMIISPESMALETTQSVVYLFYFNAFQAYDKGYASAIATLLFVIIMIITIVQMRLQKKWVNY